MTGAVWTSQEFSLETISHALQAPAYEKTVLHSYCSSHQQFHFGLAILNEEMLSLEESLSSALLFCMVTELSVNQSINHH